LRVITKDKKMNILDFYTDEEIESKKQGYSPDKDNIACFKALDSGTLLFWNEHGLGQEGLFAQNEVYFTMDKIDQLPHQAKQMFKYGAGYNRPEGLYRVKFWHLENEEDMTDEQIKFIEWLKEVNIRKTTLRGSKGIEKVKEILG